VSRRGGDEFTVILGDVHGPDDAARVAQEIVEQMGTPFQVRNVSLQIGASVGLCLYPDQAHDVSSLVAGADEAMYRAKLMGRGAYCFHERDEA
jgi:diguanylate cyclase (GGDEF)-like protein